MTFLNSKVGKICALQDLPKNVSRIEKIVHSADLMYLVKKQGQVKGHQNNEVEGHQP